MGALGSWGPWAGILWGRKQVCVGQACAQYGTLVTQQTPGKSWREGLGKKCQPHLFYVRKSYLWLFSLTCYNTGHGRVLWEGAEVCLSFRKADNIFKTPSWLLFNRLFKPLWFKFCFISILSFWISSLVSWACLLSPFHSHAVRYFLLVSVFMCTGIKLSL